MEIKDFRQRLYRVVVGLFIMTVISMGCSSLTKNDSSATAPSVKSSSGVPALYYDFGDVLVPRELRVDKKSSFIYQTEGFSAGVLVLKGRIETSSLISFFEKNMTKDNWQSISSFKSGRTMLLFQKAHRWCVINITDETFNTYVEIWVAPTTRETQTGLLK